MGVFLRLVLSVLTRTYAEEESNIYEVYGALGVGDTISHQSYTDYHI